MKKYYCPLCGSECYQYVKNPLGQAMASKTLMKIKCSNPSCGGFTKVNADILDEIETAINKAINAHKSMTWLGEYDRGFNAGMEHTIYLIKAVKDGDEDD